VAVNRTAEQTFPASLGRRQRIIAGLGIALGFGAPFVLSVVLVATSGDPALLIFPLPFLGALWAMQGLAPSGFTLEEHGVRLERRWLSRVLPYRAILSCDRERRPVGGLLAFGWNSVFGAHGWRWNPWVGWHYLAITNTRDLVSLHSTAGLIVVSPTRPDEFIARLGDRLLAAAGSSAGRSRT
jgi:hypothetical protein